MESQEIQKNTPVPLYYQLINLLMEDIRSGVLKPGNPIPTEQELAEKYDLSRTTIRKAVSELIHENILEARRPKGVFVCGPRPSEVSNGILTSFTEEFARLGRRPGSSVLEVKIIPANRLIAEQLKIRIGQDVQFVHRLRLLDDEPVSISLAYIPTTILPKLDKADFASDGPNQSLYYVLQERHGVEMANALEEVSAILLDKEEARLLNVKAGLPTIVRYRQVYDSRDRVVLYEKAILRYSYRTRLISNRQELVTSALSPDKSRS